MKAFQFERPSDAPQPFVPGRDGPIPRRPAPANGPSGEMAWGTAWGQLGPPPPGYRGGGGGGYGGDANGGDGSDTSSSTDSEDDPNASKRAHAMEKKREAELVRSFIVGLGCARAFLYSWDALHVQSEAFFVTLGVLVPFLR